ncbi:MAG: transcriptional regulator [Candidatus Nanohaloarchaea archaeon]
MSDEEKTLELKAGNLEKFEEETLEQLEELKKGKDSIIFEDTEMFRRMLTEKRQELIEEVIENPPGSIRKLAENLDRGLREVHEDVKLMENYGIIQTEEDGNTKKPRIPYDRIHIEIDLPLENEIEEK